MRHIITKQDLERPFDADKAMAALIHCRELGDLCDHRVMFLQDRTPSNYGTYFDTWISTLVYKKAQMMDIHLPYYETHKEGAVLNYSWGAFTDVVLFCLKELYENTIYDQHTRKFAGAFGFE